MKISVSHNLDPNVIAESQLPFATSRAMNSAAFEARGFLVNDLWGRSIQQRNRAFAGRAIRVSQRATKTNLVVEIRDTLGRDAFERQASGQFRSPLGGRNHLAVPVGVKRLASGAIGKTKRPRAILQQDRVFATDTGILQRMRDGRLKVLYVLTTAAKVQRRFPAYVEVPAKFEIAFEDRFGYEWFDAVASRMSRLTTRRVV